MGLDTVFSFLLAASLLALVPGPDNLFVMTHSVLHGRRAGLAVVAGLCTGLLFHTAAVAFGVALIFQSSALAFLLLKTAGGIYLLYLAWQAFTTAAGGDNAHTRHCHSLAWSYRRGVIMNISNPKVSLFFLAFLPQFISPDAASVTFQVLLLGALFMLATVVVFASIACLAGRLAGLINKTPQFQQRLQGLAGVVFVLLALNLFLAQAAS
jgi:threonine/homoserine/homoserine lactone efflux protein